MRCAQSEELATGWSGADAMDTVVASTRHMAPPILFLHGFLGTPASWDATRVHLGAHRGHAAWLPWHGLDPWTPPAPASFDSVVDEVAARIPFEEPVLVVGYSLGGRLALGLLARHAARVAGAVLVGAHPGLRGEAERAARAAEDDARADALVAGGLPAFVDAWERLPLFATQRELPEAARAEQRTARLAHQPRALAESLRVLGLGRMPPRWDTLASAGERVRLVVGARDEKLVALGAEVAAETGVLVRHIDGAGHNVALEAPALLAVELRAHR
jgi:2-succinyl-6-hydroxy-2,4-cyclohexadiene-1-carboxylate synthase